MVATTFLLLIAGFFFQASLAGNEVVDIYDTVAADGNLRLLTFAIQTAGLVTTLKIGEPLTVFAPTDAAFQKLPVEVYKALFLASNRKKLIKILEYHVVVANLTAEAIVALNPPVNFKTLAGATVTATQDQGDLKVNNASVTVPNVFGTNGIVHVIDTVLFPPPGLFDIVDTIINNGNFDILVQAIQAVGLDSTLKADGPFTLFAPSDAAFRKLPPELLIDLLLPENKQNLSQILRYHVASGNLTAAALIALNPPVSIFTFDLRSVEITQDGRKLKVNDATVLVPDVLAANGVVHVIDTVLFPSFFDLKQQYTSVPEKTRLFH